MKIHQFESEQRRNDDFGDRPWRKDAAPLNKPPSNPNYPKKPFNHDEWMKSSKPMEEDESDTPKVGDTIRTNKSGVDGKVEQLGMSRGGYTEVYFRIADGRLMKTPLDNVIVVEKLADEDEDMMEEIIDEVSTELLAKYKTAAGKDASAADKAGDYKRGDKRFSGIIKATKKQFANDAKPKTEGTMGGINRSRPAQDVSYEKVLDRNPKTAHSRVVGEDTILNDVMEKWQHVNELSVDKMRAYKQKAASSDSFRTRPLRKLAKSAQGVNQATQKINVKTGNRVGNTYEEKLSEFLDVEEGKAKKQPARPGATKDDKYKGWNLRYQVRPREGSNEFEGMAVHSKSEKMQPIKAKGSSAEEVITDIKSQIDNMRGSAQITAPRVTVDFNAQIAQDIIGHGGDIYAEISKIDGEPTLLLSSQDAGGMKLAQDRTATVNRREGKIGQQAFAMSGAEARAAGLTHARYTLGKPFTYTEGVVGYPLVFHSEVYPGEIIPMGDSGVTIAYPKGTGN